MTNILKAALMAAGLVAGTSASAAIVVYTPTAVAPVGATLVTNADISSGQEIIFSETLSPGDSAEFTFTALNDLIVSGITLGGIGSSASDLSNVEFGFTSATTSIFSFVFPTSEGAIAGGSLPGFNMAAGDVFSIFFDDGISAPVVIGGTFSTTAIPVPAALPLMIGGIAALGAVARKKKKA